MAKKSKGIDLYFINASKVKAILHKALQFNSKPNEETFPELPDVLVWLRFFLAIMYGSFLGLRNVRSATMLLHNVNLLAFIPVMYCRLYLGVENESFQMSMVFSGLFPALALSTLLWIYFFTAQNEGDELKLASLLVSTVLKGGDDEQQPLTTATAPEESEF